MTIGSWLIARVTRRAPDFVIGGVDDPYLLRWWLTPWRRWQAAALDDPRTWVRCIGRALALMPNVYLHLFLRSDDDRALHDHPWVNCSIVLRGFYREHVPGGSALRCRGDVVLRWPTSAHRIELVNGPVWTLFLTGPRVREWGFLCPRGWVHWRIFTAPQDRGAVGKGCEE